jgi:hypothetical protein
MTKLLTMAMLGVSLTWCGCGAGSSGAARARQNQEVYEVYGNTRRPRTRIVNGPALLPCR